MNFNSLKNIVDAHKKQMIAEIRAQLLADAGLTEAAFSKEAPAWIYGLGLAAILTSIYAANKTAPKGLR